MVSIRDVEPSDLEAITAIYAYYALHSTATFDEEPLSVEDMTKRREKVRAQGLPFLVAEIDGVVVGYSSATLFHLRSAWRFTIEDSVYIHHAYQRRGVGRALLSELIQRCEKLGYRQMIAAIGDSENHGSIGLHRALGFEDAGIYRSVGWKFGQWLDVPLMQRRLGEGDQTPPPEL